MTIKADGLAAILNLSGEAMGIKVTFRAEALLMRRTEIVLAKLGMRLEKARALLRVGFDETLSELNVTLDAEMRPSATERRA